MLEYREEELRPNSPTPVPITISLDCIRPESTGTCAKQNKVLLIPELTIVAFLENSDVKKFLIPLKELAQIPFLNFIPSPCLHLTVLGLKGVSSFLNWHREDIGSMVHSYFLDIKQMKVTFEHIRPGSYIVGKDQRINSISDGTVITYASWQDDAVKFHKMGQNLAEYLSKSKDIFSQIQSRKYFTVWCTLGYFNCEDFPISGYLSELLMKKPFKPFNISITVKKLSLVRYYRRNLVDSEVIKEIKLS
jgi:hypothetical protein